MALVVIRDNISGKSFQAVPGHRMYLYAESTGTLTLTVPYAPKEIEYGEWGDEWTQIDRSGNTPLLVRKGGRLPTIKFSALFAHPDPNVTMTGHINALKRLSVTRERILVNYGPDESGLWRLTDISVSSEERHPDTNEITRATVSLTLTVASDAAPAVGPLSRPAPAPPPPPRPRPARVHRVVRGDCLWDIAERYYGKGHLWPRIYDANRRKIRNPHLIYPGQAFTIP